MSHPRGSSHPFWKGGRRITKLGYVVVYMPDHPRARDGKYVLEHRLVMEQHLGRYLLQTEHVHHKNENRTDNRIENLEVMNAGAHVKMHSLEKWGSGGKRREEFDNLPREVLRKHYKDDKMTAKDIGEIYRVSGAVVRVRLVRLGIPRRDRKHSQPCHRGVLRPAQKSKTATRVRHHWRRAPA